MAFLTSMRKLTQSESGLVNLSSSESSSPHHSSVRSVNEMLEVVDPVYWELNRMSVDFDDLELGDDQVDEDFSEEFALKSPPQEW